MSIKNPIRNIYQPRFDQKTDEWILHVPSSQVSKKVDGNNYEVRLPLYLTRTYLSIGGGKPQAVQKPERSSTTFWSVKRPLECGGGTKICSIAGTNVGKMAQASLEPMKMLFDTLT